MNQRTAEPQGLSHPIESPVSVERDTADRLCAQCREPLFMPADRVSSLCQPCRADRMARKTVALEHSPLGQSLHAQSGEAWGYLAYAFERGIIDDAIGAYARLLRMFERSISAVDPTVSGILPLDCGPKTERLAVFQYLFGPLMRNLTAIDRGYHWREADRGMKSLVYADAVRWANVAESLHLSIAHAEDEAEQREIADQAIKARNASDRYRRLAEGQGW